MGSQLLYEKLQILEEMGCLKKFPNIIQDNLNDKIELREYQKRAFQYFVTYFENEEIKKNKQIHLLFQMATGSGKTVMMAGLIVYLYTKGYRNFIFFVDQTNVLEKTKLNFSDSSSSKFLFNKEMNYLGDKIKINVVENFQNSIMSKNEINICFTSTQKLHMDITFSKENAMSLNDFEDNNVVFISDESHHLNSSTKKLTKAEEEKERTWETSIMKALQANKDSVMLEFTATIDLKNKNILNKYSDKLIFNYPLKDFRESGYTKDFKNFATNTDLWTRTLIALIMSEYRKYLFVDLRLNIKPVVLLKSKTISESKRFYEEFVENLKILTENEIQMLYESEMEELKSALDYFKNKDSSFNLLKQSLQNSFFEEHLLLINNKDIEKKEQILLNTLEEVENKIRAIFAVDMLNEGWDVLNLFDIVRLFDTRQGSGKAGEIGKYTISEAQLIGRGSRYCPFLVDSETNKYKRKYDFDISNKNRILETMYFHSKNDSRYITELKAALIASGLEATVKETREYILKEEFKETKLYKYGYIFTNERIIKDRSEVDCMDVYIRNSTYNYQISNLKGETIDLFDEKNENSIKYTIKNIKMKEIDYNIISGAIGCFPELKFNILKNKFPNLTSMKEFLNSDNYIGNVKIDIKMLQNQQLKGRDYFEACKVVFNHILGYILSIKEQYQGTREFKPKKISSIIKNKTINITEKNENGGYGNSQNQTTNEELHLNLKEEDWYVYTDNYGTSEEKRLLKYFKNNIKKLLDDKNLKYYIVRNERIPELAIYSFKDGARFEPDFILFIEKQDMKTELKSYQIFMEPKGEHLLSVDKWKEEFLIEIQSKAKISEKDKIVIGLPFFNFNTKLDEFKIALEKIISEI